MLLYRVIGTTQFCWHAKHGGYPHLAAVLYFLIVLATSAKESIFSPRVVPETRLVIVENIVSTDSLQVWPDLLENGAHSSGTDFGSAPFDVLRLSHFYPMAPPLPEVHQPVLARAILAPSCLDIMFGTLCLYQILQVPLTHWLIVLQTNLEGPQWLCSVPTKLLQSAPCIL